MKAERNCQKSYSNCGAFTHVQGQWTLQGINHPPRLDNSQTRLSASQYTEIMSTEIDKLLRKGCSMALLFCSILFLCGLGFLFLYGYMGEETETSDDSQSGNHEIQSKNLQV